MLKFYSDILKEVLSKGFSTNRRKPDPKGTTMDGRIVENHKQEV